MNIQDLKPYPKNAKQHPKKQVAQIARSIEKFGFNQPIVIDKNNTVIVGHGRLEAAKVLGLAEVPVIKVNLTEEEANAYRLADNKLNESPWDMNLVIEELKLLSQPLLELTGFDLDLLLDDQVDRNGNMVDKFMVPPFSVLDTKQGYWQDRRRQWLAQGLKSEIGRAEGLIGGGKSGVMLSEINGGTSIFDPVLCELMYKWFNVPNGLIIDPFAGGSVRGVVASKLGYPYIGFELRAEQVEANRTQATELCQDPQPVWVAGDSNVTLDTTPLEADLILSCPPYADLEVYSDDPADISTMAYPDFIKVYRSIITKACAKLKNDRFAVWVIGEVRDDKGVYYNFLGDTIQAFKDAGLQYYNEIVLLNAIGTLPLRAGRQFNAGRKVGKCHQNVLVFYKGNPKNIKQTFGELDLSNLEGLSEDVTES